MYGRHLCLSLYLLSQATNVLWVLANRIGLERGEDADEHVTHTPLPSHPIRSSTYEGQTPSVTISPYRRTAHRITPVPATAPSLSPSTSLLGLAQQRYVQSHGNLRNSLRLKGRGPFGSPESVGPCEGKFSGAAMGKQTLLYLYDTQNLVRAYVPLFG